MSILQVTTVTTSNATSDLVLKTSNTTGPQIVIAANGQSITLRGNSSSNSVFINTSSVFINGVDLSLISPGSLSANGSFTISGNVTPATITSNTSAYNPGTSNVYIIRLSANSVANGSNTTIAESYISGLTAATNGQIIILTNIGNQKIQLKNEDSVNETTAANRFNLPNHVFLDTLQSIKIIYDGTLARWRPINSLLIAQDYKYSLTKGFFSGGNNPTFSAVTDRTTYSSETTAAVAGANLSQARVPSGVGNSDKGFSSGGFVTPTAVTTSDRITRSSETTAAVAGANLSQSRQWMGMSGNFDKGFFTGGVTTPAAPFGTYYATADRTSYSSETTAAVSGANLSQARLWPAGSGNVDKGFISGGNFPGGYVVTSDRTTYSTEVTAAVTGTNLSQARSGCAAAGNSDKSFSMGGYAVSAVTTTADRTTYASETTAAVAGANLSTAKESKGAAGNDTKGFFCGGYTTGFVATADRCTYSTETTAAVAGANLSQSRTCNSGV